jgi:hypothetical protein
MFQYAFFRQMQQWHGSENVKLDISTYHWKAHNGLELDKIFNLDLEKDSVPAAVSLKFADVGYKFHHRMLRRLRGKKHRSYVFWKQLNLEDYKDLNDIYIEGYWNEEKYFEGVKEEIRKIYQFKPSPDSWEKELLKEIESTESVAVHVRRGDYVTSPVLLPMCQPDYYRKAWNILAETEKNLKFFIFSDEMDWCRKSLSFLPNVVFVENPKKLQAYKDMMLMSKCRHNIIANSTFSWWAAWLNSNPDKKVIYPESVFLTYRTMPEEWICLK